METATRMNKPFRWYLLVFPLAAITLALVWVGGNSQAQKDKPVPLIVGEVRDGQNQPVQGAQVSLLASGSSDILTETSTQPDGRYSLPIPNPLPSDPILDIERAHFKGVRIPLQPENIQALQSGEATVIPEVTLSRQINLAFWIATLIFVAVLVLIATGVLHNTLAALVGAALIFAFSYLGEPISEQLFIFDFPTSIQYIDWNVIFLVMGMMIVIAVVENTGIFQWLAFFAYRISGGRTWLLLPILMLITGVASAFLDNVTTMLLMTPISVQIALALGINPLALLMPEVMASNVIGVSTLVGTPTNILIGSFGNISFNDFLVNLTPGVLLAFVGLLIYNGLVYRKELSEARNASPALIERLAERGQITNPANLKKAGWVGAGMLILFVFGESVHLVPAVTALIGATALMVWIRPNIEEMIEAVDWTTLVFFMSLFIVVGGIQEVGLISFIADGIGRVVGQNLTLTMLAIIWLSAVLSTVVANIPFTAAMLPVVGFLTATVPGAEGKVLFYCLSVGSAMGGNGSLIGASANMVTAGIADGAGYPISYAYFLKKGFPALLVTVGLATLWLFLRFH
jgi:Na+/H+ antiporter NhaD/arsenite permease-like protein